MALPGRLVVATGRRRTADWLYTVAHEYAHFLQWRNDSPLWRETNYYKLERETERAALQLCQQFKLPIPRRVLLQEHHKYMKKLSRVS
jgi:Zn-dependent peptidase ImmA (M78 family)